MVVVASADDPANVDPASAVAPEYVDMADVPGSSVATLVLETTDRDD